MDAAGEKEEFLFPCRHFRKHTFRYKGFALRKMGWCVAVEKNLLRITDGGQEKSLCRGGGARPRKVTGGDDAAEFVRRHFAPAYSHQCARNGPDHIAQEAVSADGEDEFRSLLPPSGICDFADVGLVGGVEFGEGREVVECEQMRGGFVSRAPRYCHDVSRLKGSFSLRM